MQTLSKGSNWTPAYIAAIALGCKPTIFPVGAILCLTVLYWLPFCLPKLSGLFSSSLFLSLHSTFGIRTQQHALSFSSFLLSSSVLLLCFTLLFSVSHSEQKSALACFCCPVTSSSFLFLTTFSCLLWFSCLYLACLHFIFLSFSSVFAPSLFWSCSKSAFFFKFYFRKLWKHWTKPYNAATKTCNLTGLSRVREKVEAVIVPSMLANGDYNMCMIWWTDCLQTGLKKCNLWFWKECSFLCSTIVSDTLKPIFCPNTEAGCCRLCSSCCHLLSSGVNVKHTSLFSPPLLSPHLAVWLWEQPVVTLPPSNYFSWPCLYMSFPVLLSPGISSHLLLCA